MGIGLGRNSPVKLTLSKDNYSALIERHGQWIRWRIASKCSCVKYGNMQPDIHCKICGGRGFTYSYQKDSVGFDVVMEKETSGILQISERFVDSELVEVYDTEGNRFPDAKKFGQFIYLNPQKTLEKGVYYNVIVRTSTEKTISIVEVSKKNDLGYYVIPGLVSSQPNTDGVYYNASGDIVSIGKITDSNGIEYKAEEFRLNQFRIEPKTDEDGEIIPIADPITVENVTFIPPFIFALLNQNLSKADMQMMVDLQGDAVLSYPYEYDVSNDDVLTVLAGTYTNKEVVVRQEYKTDTLGVYFVYDIVSCTGIVDGKIVDYIEGKDFIIVGTNKIKWLETEDSNYPDSGDTYSITYHVLPTYKVVKDIPQLRTSENQRFPKKAVVKLLTTYAENNGINKQNVDGKGINGSY